MSRILGRINDVLQISEYFKSVDLPKYKKDKTTIEWDELKNVPQKIKLYLPDESINLIQKEEICLCKNPLRKYTFISIPEFDDEKRIIRFPSNKAYKEYEREYAFFLGCLLASYQKDTEEEFLELGKEYNDVLPLYLDYLLLKEEDNDNDYSLKYLNYLKKYTKHYGKSYNDYSKFYEFSNNAMIHDLNDREYNKYIELCKENDEKMENCTLAYLTKLSSFDGVLQLIDKNLSKEEINDLIHDLMNNDSQSRSSVLYNYGIESYGYKRLRKEIDKYK